jgi:hypothetical protein
MIDHYSVFQTFAKKYGQPQTMSANEAVWQDTKVYIRLERPLTLKYIDRRIFDSLVQSGGEAADDAKAAAIIKDTFLDGL